MDILPRGIDEPELARDPIFDAGVSTHSFLKAIHQPSNTPLGVLCKEMLNPRQKAGSGHSHGSSELT